MYAERVMDTAAGEEGRSTMVLRAPSVCLTPNDHGASQTVAPNTSSTYGTLILL